MLELSEPDPWFRSGPQKFCTWNNCFKNPFLKEKYNAYSEKKKMQKMGKGIFNLKKNDDNTLQADGLDNRGFHLPHHILIKEKTLKMYF